MTKKIETILNITAGVFILFFIVALLFMEAYALRHFIIKYW